MYKFELRKGIQKPIIYSNQRIYSPIMTYLIYNVFFLRLELHSHWLNIVKIKPDGFCTEAPLDA